jgi:hypothetical protein
MVDGSGSWGPGIEAAAWFRDWLASAHKNDNTISTTDVTTALRAGIEQLPSVVIDDDFHWTFSIVAVIADDTTIRMGACGAFAAAAVSRSLIDRLLTPARPIDELVTRGHVSESEAECHKHSNMLSGPFFGVDGQDDLIWIPPIENPPETQVIIGDSGLQRYLESQRSHELQTDPVAIRDAVEQFCGRSAPTAVLSAS